MAVRGVLTASVIRAGGRLLERVGRSFAATGQPDDDDAWRGQESPAPVEQLSLDVTPVDADIVARTLGGTRIWVRGTPIERWPTRRGLMVLRYLLWQDRPVLREHLMDLLWPDATHQAARNNLNVALYGLRRTLEQGGPGPYVVFRDGSYSIADGCHVWVDARLFVDACDRAERALRAGRVAAAEPLLRDAVTLYGGPLFADDTSGEWYLTERRVLSDRYATALHDLASLRLDVGDCTEAIELARRVLRVDPCHEVTHRLLMQAYARRNLHHLAVRQYHDCVATLDRMLDVGPHPATTRVFREVAGQA